MLSITEFDLSHKAGDFRLFSGVNAIHVW